MVVLCRDQDQAAAGPLEDEPFIVGFLFEGLEKAFILFLVGLGDMGLPLLVLLSLKDLGNPFGEPGDQPLHILVEFLAAPGRQVDVGRTKGILEAVDVAPVVRHRLFRGTFPEDLLEGGGPPRPGLTEDKQVEPVVGYAQSEIDAQ